MKQDRERRTIIIANTAEAFSKPLSRAGNTPKGKQRINHELALSQRAFFWESDNKAIVTPYKIPNLLFQTNMSSLGYRNVDNLFPKIADINLCQMIMKDKKLWTRLIGLIKQNPYTRLTPYAVTPDFITLVKELKKENVDFEVWENEDTSNIVEYLDSKIGFREVLATQIKIPKGFVCKSSEEVFNKVNWFLSKNKSCVIKANVGESGWGMLIIDKAKFKDNKKLIPYIKQEFANDNIWQDELFVVEEYLIVDMKIGGGSLSTEVFVSDEDLEITYSCEQILSKTGEFLGIGVGKSGFSKQIQIKLEDIAMKVGQKYRDLGYRGFFDLDFVITEDRTIYAVETNTRRTGGTHVYDLGRRIFKGSVSNWGYLISEDSFRYSSKQNILSDEKIINTVEDLLFPIKEKNNGIVITLINNVDPILGYIVVADSRKQAVSLQKKFRDRWK